MKRVHAELSSVPIGDLRGALAVIAGAAAEITHGRLACAAVATDGETLLTFCAGESELLDRAPRAAAEIARRAASSRQRALIFSEGNLPIDQEDEPVRLAKLIWVPVRASLSTVEECPSRKVSLEVGGLILEDRGGPPFDADEILQPMCALSDAVSSSLLHHRLLAPRGPRLSRFAFRPLLARVTAAAERDGLDLALLLISVDAVQSDDVALSNDAQERLRTVIDELDVEGAVTAELGDSTAVLLIGAGREAAEQVAETISERFSGTEDQGASLRTGVASRATLEDGQRDAWHLERAATEELMRALPFELDSAGGPDEPEDGEVLERWRILGAAFSERHVRRLLFVTLRSIVDRFSADRASFWRQRDGAWTRQIIVRRRDEVAGTGQFDQVVAERAGLEGEHRSVFGREAHDVLGLRCGDPGEELGVLLVARAGKTLDAPPAALASLRDLANEMGSVLSAISEVERIRERRSKAEERVRKQAMELRRLVRMRQGLLGAHPKIQESSKLIEQSARSNAAILLIGETGTGKEAAARLIHRLSNRTGPLVTVDCGAIPSQLLESELFGHEKGAFTGAEARKPGRVEEAHRGTLFLDEIGELPLSLQPKLLRVLQESTVRRVGGDHEIELDLRIVSATNRDLFAMVAEGAFREDLLYRIRVIEIALPPLRERGDDVLLLSLYFLRQFSAELGRDLLPLSSESQTALLKHPWPGNIRELQNRLRRAAILASGTEITVKDLELEESSTPRARARSIAPRIRSESQAAAIPPARPLAPQAAAAELGGSELSSAVEEWFWKRWAADPEPRSPPQELLESFLLRAALQVGGGSLSRAANLLGMHPATFRAHLKNLSDAALSRTIREHRLGPLLEAEIAGFDDGARSGGALWDELLKVLLKELLVYCHGNKTEMARLVGWGRATLGRYLARAGIGDAAPV